MYDLIIIGSGPAGLTASIYASRYRLSHFVIGKVLGGEITLAHKVENYPGFVSISGLELAQKIGEQVKALGAEIISDSVGRIEIVSEAGVSPFFKISTEEGKEYKAKTLIVATGSERKKLNIPGEEKYLGRGVSYCITCDIPFFKEKEVAIIGGADAALSGALHAAEFATRVYIIYRGASFRAEPIWVEETLKNPKITPLYKTNILEIKGDGKKVTNIILDNPFNNSRQLPIDGIFIEIGGVPGTSLLIPLGVEMDEGGYVKVTSKMETNIPGLFAAGDFTSLAQVLRQMTTASSQGAIAASSAYEFLKGKMPPQILGIAS